MNIGQLRERIKDMDDATPVAVWTDADQYHEIEGVATKQGRGDSVVPGIWHTPDEDNPDTGPGSLDTYDVAVILDSWDV